MDQLILLNLQTKIYHMHNTQIDQVTKQKIIKSLTTFQSRKLRQSKARPQPSTKIYVQQHHQTQQSFNIQRSDMLRRSVFHISSLLPNSNSCQVVLCIISCDIAVICLEKSMIKNVFNHLQKTLKVLEQPNEISIIGVYHLQTPMYPEIEYQLIFLWIEPNLKIMSGMGYNFSPFCITSRAQSNRVEHNKQSDSHKYVLDIINDRLVLLEGFEDYPEQQDSSVFYDQKLNNILSGSPIFQKLEDEFLLIGFYGRLEDMSQSSHKCLIFNPFIFKLLDRLPMMIGQKLNLNFNPRASKLTLQDISFLAQLQFDRLVCLQLSSNGIGKRGAKLISKGRWKELSFITLNGNELESYSMRHLSKAIWKILSISAVNNKISNDGATWMGAANWRDLFYINLYKNRMNDFGMQVLMRSDWTLLSILNLQKNILLHESNWNKLHKSLSLKFTKLQIFSL